MLTLSWRAKGKGSWAWVAWGVEYHSCRRVPGRLECDVACHSCRRGPGRWECDVAYHSCRRGPGRWECDVAYHSCRRGLVSWEQYCCMMADCQPWWKQSRSCLLQPPQPWHHQLTGSWLAPFSHFSCTWPTEGLWLGLWYLKKEKSTKDKSNRK